MNSALLMNAKYLHGCVGFLSNLMLQEMDISG